MLAVELHQPHPLLGARAGALVDAAAAVARVDEGAEADPAQVPRLAGGDVAKEVRDHALRQVPGLDPVLDRELAERRHQAPVAADHACHQAVVAEVVEAARLAVALPRRVDEAQPARRALGEEALLERHRQPLGEADADEAAGGDGVAVAHELDRLGSADDLALAAGAQAGDALQA